MPRPVIVATARSPIGRAFKGSLTAMRADDLAAQMVQAALAQVPSLPVEDLEDLILGCALPGGEQGFNMARVVSLLAGLDDVPGTTVNRYDASSLQAIRMAAHAVASGEGGAFVAAGAESVSRFVKGNSDTYADTTNVRFAAAQDRSAARQAADAPVWSASAGLADVYVPMGLTAENVAQLEGVSRAEMDEFALESQRRAASAIADGFFAGDITPVVLSDATVVAHDDSPRLDTSAAALAALAPVFRDGGSVTAGNSCPLNDGAAAVVVMDEDRARSLGITPLARIVATAVSGINPEIMGLGPVDACRRVLARAGMAMGDMDLVELNEAFAAQVIPCMRHLGIDHGRLNVHGGAIALGHPFGMTGARLVTTLLHGLEVRGGALGLVTVCVGGGQGMAMVLERLS